jgi:hypothetical protein
VKKASRELNNQTSKLDDIQKIDTLQKRCADLFAEMKRHERDNLKNKKRADQLQKEKDHSRTELSKNVSLREKLEKLCRELQRENNRLKVCYPSHLLTGSSAFSCSQRHKSRSASRYYVGHADCFAG